MTRAKKVSWRRTQPYAVVSAAVVPTACGGAPYRATKRVRGVSKWGGGAMRTCPLGPQVELPMGYGATKRVKGMSKWGGRCLWGPR